MVFKRLAKLIPAALGLPAKFTEFRPSQLTAIMELFESDKRFKLLSAPTGSGKTLCGLALSTLNGKKSRTLYLTATKGLQQQVINDSQGMGLADIRGLSNYRCVAVDKQGVLAGYGSPGDTCDAGPCKVGMFCPLRKAGGCLHYDAVAIAEGATLVSSNYAYWLSLGRYGDPLAIGNFDLIIMDEAHSVAKILTDFCAVELSRHDVHALLAMQLPPINEGVGVWADWAKKALVEANKRMTMLREQIKHSRDKSKVKTLLRLGRLTSDLEEMSKAREWKRTARTSKAVSMPGEATDWVAYETPAGARFSPVWAGQYAEQYLFRGIPNIVLSSGTLLPSTARRLSIPETDYSWHETTSSFDSRRRPVYYIPTVRVDTRMTDYEIDLWVKRIDEIIAGRLDLKGLIHTVSYQRAQDIIDRSKYRDMMLTHTTRTTRDVFEQFKRSKRPVILVSPSAVEGVDLPHDECRYIIVVKVPFADSRDPVFRARRLHDKEYPNELAAERIIQMCGRGMRDASDFVQAFVIDDHYKWMRGKVAWPKWFRDGWRTAYTVPPPLTNEDLTGPRVRVKK